MASAPIFFILGGPGSGKGTNCALLVEEFGLNHFSAGDLLREEAAKDTELGHMITKILKDGQIVPMEVTIRLLVEAMAKVPNARGFLLDGFPRKMDQALKFEEEVAKARQVVYFSCTEQEMEARLLCRAGQGSGRSDDNAETIRRRFKTNLEQCMPVVDKYRHEGRLTEIPSQGTREEVYDKVRKAFLSFGLAPLKTQA